LLKIFTYQCPSTYYETIVAEIYKSSIMKTYNIKNLAFSKLYGNFKIFKIRKIS